MDSILLFLFPLCLGLIFECIFVLRLPRTKIRKDSIFMVVLKPFLCFTCQRKRKQSHVYMLKISFLKAHGSYQFIECREMSIWIFIIHSSELMRTNQAEESWLHLQSFSGGWYCYARKISRPLLHSIVSKCLPGWNWSLILHVFWLRCDGSTGRFFPCLSLLLFVSASIPSSCLFYLRVKC